MSRKNQLLDPIGTMCKLVGLNFAEFQTKVKIKDHVLSLDKPNDVQFITRWYYGDGREDISELYYVVTRIIKWYLVRDKSMISPETEEFDLSLNSEDMENLDLDYDGLEINFDIDLDGDDDDVDNNNDDRQKISDKINRTFEKTSVKIRSILGSNELKIMINYLCKSLSKLQKTYKFGNVVFTLQYFINLLQGALEGRFNESKLPKYITDAEKSNENLIDYGKMKSIWKLKDLKTICRLYDECFQVQADKELIHEVKHSLIKGHLKTINRILKITDNKFQKLILNSKRG
jgi:hypothetical protein